MTVRCAWSASHVFGFAAVVVAHRLPPACAVRSPLRLPAALCLGPRFWLSRRGGFAAVAPAAGRVRCAGLSGCGDGPPGEIAPEVTAMLVTDYRAALDLLHDDAT
ncbi:hypothetical protein ABZS78_26395, partial [Streptomyces decoyicus]